MKEETYICLFVIQFGTLTISFLLSFSSPQQYSSSLRFLSFSIHHSFLKPQLFTTPGTSIDAYIIPSQDAHQSEFIAECYMRRAYISGFTGRSQTKRQLFGLMADIFYR
ncbi:hypothetical protein POM88_053707 [Heracleum sosnowskyi]|uniref:Uncharacterized protein n=1 Tax=Heracleum sosnowskyi TaxID=360622 RepID=A0AAD8LXG4_9APIA|nr:hypothetical protein POM88_053707 [Heracleum sosnowskyi]